MHLNNDHCGVGSNLYARAISVNGGYSCVAFFDNTTKRVIGHVNGSGYSFPVGFNVQALHLEWSELYGTFYLYIYTDKFSPEPRAEYVQNIAELF